MWNRCTRYNPKSCGDIFKQLLRENMHTHIDNYAVQLNFGEQITETFRSKGHDLYVTLPVRIVSAFGGSGRNSSKQ